MKRRSVLTGLGAAVGTSVAGCLDSNSGDGDETDSETPPWLNRIALEVDEEANQMKVVARISSEANVSEVGMNGPDGDLINSAIVSDGQRRVTLRRIDVQTIAPYFFGLEPGSYEVFAWQDGQKTEGQPVDLFPGFSVESVSLDVKSREGKEWVSGFKTSATNQGRYPDVMSQYGAVDGVPNPPEDGLGSAEPVEADDAIVWPDRSVTVTENRLGSPGPLVVPGEQGTPDQDLVDELTGEHTATLEHHTAAGTYTASVDYRLEGDLVTLENGYAMSGGEVTGFEVTSTPTPE